MAFYSIRFLSIFLPIFLVLYLFSAPKFKNAIALLASLLFFSLNQFYYLPLLILMIIVNFYLSRKLENLRDNPGKGRVLLVVGCLFNLIPLLFFKINVSFGVGWLSSWWPEEVLTYFQKYIAPLGLSYIVFQLISYLLDVQHGLCDSEKSFRKFALYVLLFPKLLVGPIVRYRDISSQLADRPLNTRDVASGIRRFILGLAKKILIADTIAGTINPALALKTPNFSTPLAWFILIGYALQLYFDFSGITDMAIGLGQMMGFKFMENFNYPYISRSVSEFWRRWHISLSSWFREYVFYPLEFTRRKIKWMVLPLNIFIVFLLTGLWHGLTINFIIWGGLHGLALAFESTFFGRWLKKAWRPIQHFYTLAVVLVGWIFFRSPTVNFAIEFLGRLLGSNRDLTPVPFSVTRPFPLIDNTVWIALIFGIIVSLPVIPFFKKYFIQLSEKSSIVQALGYIGTDVFLFVTLILVASALVSRTNIPTTIYARF